MLLGPIDAVTELISLRNYICLCLFRFMHCDKTMETCTVPVGFCGENVLVRY